MLDVDEARAIAARWRPQFQSEENFETSWNRFMEKVGDMTPSGLETWLAKDLARDQVQHAGIVREPILPVQQVEPDLSARTESAYIAAGDLHDWRNPMLSPQQHEAICPRCQLSKRSRELVDERAAQTNKTPFPGMGGLLSGFTNRRQWCADCGLSEDELPGEFCDRSFWHLSEIWRALHPDQPVMPDMGPFMRAFLRSQRPAEELAA